MSSARFLLPVFRQRLFTVRPIHTSIASLNGFEQRTRSFNDRFRNQRKKVEVEPTRLIQITALPFTTTSEDVRKLAREAFNKGDRAIIDMVFPRKSNFVFEGKCVVLMATPEDASRLISYGNRRSLGGHIIKMEFASTDKPETYLKKLRKPELQSASDQTSAAGRSVIMSGFPMNVPDYVMGYLRSKNFYPADGVPDNIICLTDKFKSPVNKFLIKFDSESEAWRCVRAFHNEKYSTLRESASFNIYVDVVY